MHTGHYGGFFDVGNDGEELVEMMDKFKIEKALVCHVDNEAIKESLEEYPERLIGKV